MSDSKDLQLTTTTGTVTLYNFDRSKLTAVIPSGSGSTIHYDGIPFDVDVDVNSINSFFNEPPKRKSILEELSDEMSTQPLCGSENFIIIGEENRLYFNPQQKQLVNVSWTTNYRYTDNSIVISSDIMIEVNQYYKACEASDPQIDSIVLRFKSKNKTHKSPKSIDVKAFIEDQVMEYLCDYRMTGSSCKFMDTDFITFESKLDMGVRVYPYIMYDHLATDLHVKSLLPYFTESYGEVHKLRMERIQQDNRAIIQKMQDDARILSASIIASAINQSGKNQAYATCRAANVTPMAWL